MPVLSSGLVDLPDSGSGAGLVKITRDSKGRVEGTQSATTDDLTEGANLYFTDGRADARVAVLAADLASSASGKGDDLVAEVAHSGVGPAYLQTLSAVRNGEEVAAIKAIPAAQHAAIYTGSSTYDATADLNDLIADMIGRGGQILLPRGKVQTTGLTLNYGLLAADDSLVNRITIRGHGSKASELQMTAATGNVVNVAGQWGLAPTLTIEGVRLRGNGGTTRGLRASNVAGLNLRDVVCQGAQYGWEFEDCLALNLINASTIFNTYGARLFRTTNTYPNLINMFGGSIGGNSVWGLESTGGTNLNLCGVGVEGNGDGQATGAATSWGIKVIDAGAEGGVAVNLDGCYFEVNNGQADLWVLQSSRAVSVKAGGNTFNRISNTNYTVNNVRLETSGTGTIAADLGTNAYWTAGTYVRDAARRSVLATGVANSVNVTYEHSMGASSSEVDRPFLAQSGRLNDPDTHVQGWIRGDGASSTIVSQCRVSTYTRAGTGDYEVVFEHNIPAAKCYAISLESTVPVCWQVVSETASSIRFTVKNGAGAAVDATRVFVQALG